MMTLQSSIDQICVEFDCQFLSIVSSSPSLGKVEEMVGAASTKLGISKKDREVFAYKIINQDGSIRSSGDLALPIPMTQPPNMMIVARLNWRLFGPPRDLSARLTIKVLQALVNFHKKSSMLLRGELQMAVNSTKAIINGFNIAGSDGPFEVTLDYLLTTLGIEHGSIWELHDTGFLTLEALRNCSISNYKNNCIPKNEGIVSRALKEGAERVTIVQDIREIDLVNKSLYSIVKGKTAYVIRLGQSDPPIGVAVLVSAQGGEEVSTLISQATFDQFLALEIQAKRRTQRLEVFSAIRDLFASEALELSTIAQALCEKLIRIMHCQGVSIFIKSDLDHLSQSLKLVASACSLDCVASQRYNDFHNGSIIEYSVSAKSLTGSVALTRMPIVCNNLSQDLRNSRNYREVAAGETESWIGVPLVDAQRNCIGVLRCTGKLTRLQEAVLGYVFDYQDADVLQTAGTIIAPYLMQAHAKQKLQNVNAELKATEEIREHEMRGPLQIIADNGSFVKLYIDDIGVTSKRKRLEAIGTNVMLCSTLLTSTQLPKSLQAAGGLEVIHLRTLIDELVKVFRYQAESRSQGVLKFDAQIGEVRESVISFMKIDSMGFCNVIFGNRGLLQRAFYNVGINAVKYAKPGESGKLTIRISQDNVRHEAVVIFEDEGIGIPKDEAERVFEGGFRGKRAQHQKGKGLGLRIAKDILELHNGSIELIRNNSDPKTVIACRLPFEKELK